MKYSTLFFYCTDFNTKENSIQCIIIHYHTVLSRCKADIRNPLALLADECSRNYLFFQSSKILSIMEKCSLSAKIPASLSCASKALRIR